MQFWAPTCCLHPGRPGPSGNVPERGPAGQPPTHAAQAARKQALKNLYICTWNRQTLLVHFKMHSPVSPLAPCTWLPCQTLPIPDRPSGKRNRKAPSHSSRTSCVLREALGLGSGVGRQGQRRPDPESGVGRERGRLPLPSLPAQSSPGTPPLHKLPVPSACCPLSPKQPPPQL